MLSQDDILTLHAAVDCGLLPAASCMRWALRIIETVPAPPSWLADLATGKTTADVVGALRDAAATFGEVPSRDISPFLGVLLLRYDRGLASLGDTLRLAAEWADGRNFGSPDCEALYALLTRLERGADSRSVYADAVTLLARHRDFARHHLATCGVEAV